MDSLSAYLQQLESEGVRDSGGFFSLSSEKVAERYASLLSIQPALPWLRWLQLAYRLRARRCRAQLRNDEFRLQCAGCPELQGLHQALMDYPRPIEGRLSLLHEVLWLFLAQKPQRIVLTSAAGQLHIRPDGFEFRDPAGPTEEDLCIAVELQPNWLNFARRAWLSATLHREIRAQAASMPGVLEWDGRVVAEPWKFPPSCSLIITTLVARESSVGIPHLACPFPAEVEPVHVQVGPRHLELPGSRGPWFILEGFQGEPLFRGAQEEGILVASECSLGPARPYLLPGERMRVRLAFAYRPGPAEWIPVIDGIRLESRPLPGWPEGCWLVAACPPDLKTDYSGLKLVEGEAVQSFLEHLRGRYARRVGELVVNFPMSARRFAMLGDQLAR